MPIWERIIRPILFQLPAESVHHWSMSLHSGASRIPLVKPFWRWVTGPADSRLSVECMGLKFRSPVGLAAGFDKQGRWFESLGALGFGSIETGSVTGQAQPGNPKPRLFRLPRDQAIINRMGFNSAGADAVASWYERHPRRLKNFRESCVLGINLGKTKTVSLENAHLDYEYSLERLFPYGDYFVVNVSSPNTAGLRDLQQGEMLTSLIHRLTTKLQTLARQAGISDTPPLLLKIAPDLTGEQIEEIASIALSTVVAGVIATNTTVVRSGLTTDSQVVSNCGEGGLSGRPLHKRSVNVIHQLYKVLNGQKIIVGVGGIFDGDDVWRMMGAGANLVQLYTGFIYGGPKTVSKINRRLLELMNEQGISRVHEITGKLSPE